MNYDRLMYFTLQLKDQELVKQYLSPENENSIFKNVPLNQLDQVKRIARTLVMGPIRTKFRGPRLDAMRLYCLKKNARSASIYPV